jgi:hypothetical protein
MPFHVDTPALPQLSAQQWSRLLTNVSHRRPRPRSEYSSTHIHIDSSDESDSDDAAAGRPSSATLLLSSPHFTDVERLLQRFSNVLPGMPVLGGVTEHDAWLDTESSWGALFLGGRVFCQGAIGCVMHGPLAVQHMLVQGCQPAPASKVMTVTAAAENYILSLDGAPAQDPVSESWSVSCCWHSCWEAKCVFSNAVAYMRTTWHTRMKAQMRTLHQAWLA